MVFFSIGIYLSCYAVISYTFVNDDQFGSMVNLASFSAVYFALILFIHMFGIIDTGIDYMQRYLKVRRVQAAEEAEQARKQVEMEDPHNVSVRVTDYHRKCYSNG